MKGLKRDRMGMQVCVFGFFFYLMLLSGSANGAIPHQINYQGYLTNAAGVPVNGAVQMVFRIYDAESGGTELWNEAHNVTVNHGVYNVVLGASSLLPNPITLSFNQPYYLGIKVGADSEMTPRIPLTSVGYAYRAKTVESVGSHTHSGGDITTGTVLEPRVDSAIARTSALSAHTSNINNPHSTTAVQVGAAPTVHTHSGSDITIGTVAEGRIDSLIARDSEVTSAISTHTSNASAHHARYTNAEAVAAILAADGTGSGLDADLLDGQHASAFALSSHNHNTLYYTKAEVDGLISSLQAQITTLQNLLQGVTRSANNIYITGANLHIRSGSGSTSGTVNGLGNIIVGYNETRGTGDNRTGSHNLILGTRHNYSSYGGILAGYQNTISGIYASAIGGQQNTASGNYSSVSGAATSTASGINASVSGGTANTASGNYSSVCGGAMGQASGTYSSVSGGGYNQATTDYASVSGGYFGIASGYYSSISGGGGNTANYGFSSVSGGRLNTANGEYSSVSGGYQRSVIGRDYAWTTASGVLYDD